MVTQTIDGKDEVKPTLLDQLLGKKKGKCGHHAATIASSCGATTKAIEDVPQFRCDLRPHYSTVKHHVCGETWSIEWGE